MKITSLTGLTLIVIRFNKVKVKVVLNGSLGLDYENGLKKWAVRLKSSHDFNLACDGYKILCIIRYSPCNGYSISSNLIGSVVTGYQVISSCSSD